MLIVLWAIVLLAIYLLVGCWVLVVQIMNYRGSMSEFYNRFGGALMFSVLWPIMLSIAPFLWISEMVRRRDYGMPLRSLRLIFVPERRPPLK